MKVQTLRKLLPYVRQQGTYFPLILCCTLAAALLAALQPWPMKLVVDHLLGQAPWPPLLAGLFSDWTSGSILVVLVGGGFALFLLTALLDAALAWSWTVAGRRMVNQLSEDLFARLQRRSLLFHNRSSVGDIMSRVTVDSWCVYQGVQTLVFAPLHAVLMVTVMVVLMWQLNPGLTGVALMVAPMVVAASMLAGKPLRQVARKRREIESAIQSHLQQTLSGIPVVQAFTREEQEQARFEEFANSAIRAQQRSTLWGSLNSLTSGFLATLGTGIVLWLGARQVLAGTLTIGGLLVFLAYLGSLQAQVKVFAGLYTLFQGTQASIDRVTEVLDVTPEIRDQPGARPISISKGEIQLDRVTFGYEPGQPVLHQVSLTIQPGETVALIGPSGAGKSTLFSLVPRLFDPWSGQVLIEGKDLGAWTLASLRNQIAMLHQEPFLFPWSVAENIAFGQPDASRDQIVEAARQANAHEFIERMSEGYDSLLGERSSTLSGGERQRLAMARAFLKNAPILLLDEPTSAVDAATEQNIMETLKRLMTGRTTLLIAHRLSTLQVADRIAVIEGGHLVESGTHSELMGAGGLYARYQGMQALPDEQSTAVS